MDRGKKTQLYATSVCLVQLQCRVRSRGNDDDFFSREGPDDAHSGNDSITSEIPNPQLTDSKHADSGGIMHQIVIHVVDDGVDVVLSHAGIFMYEVHLWAGCLIGCLNPEENAPESLQCCETLTGHR